MICIYYIFKNIYRICVECYLYINFSLYDKDQVPISIKTCKFISRMRKRFSLFHFFHFFLLFLHPLIVNGVPSHKPGTEKTAFSTSCVISHAHVRVKQRTKAAGIAIFSPPTTSICGVVRYRDIEPHISC